MNSQGGGMKLARFYFIDTIFLKFSRSYELLNWWLYIAHAHAQRSKLLSYRRVDSKLTNIKTAKFWRYCLPKGKSNFLSVLKSRLFYALNPHYLSKHELWVCPRRYKGAWGGGLTGPPYEILIYICWVIKDRSRL